MKIGLDAAQRHALNQMRENPDLLSALRLITGYYASLWAKRVIEESQSDTPNINLLMQWGGRAVAYETMVQKILEVTE